MATTGEHYAIADALLVEATRDAKVLEGDRQNKLYRDAVPRYERALDVKLRLAQVHATLATVTE